MNNEYECHEPPDCMSMVQQVETTTGNEAPFPTSISRQIHPAQEGTGSNPVQSTSYFGPNAAYSSQQTYMLDYASPSLVRPPSSTTRVTLPQLSRLVTANSSVRPAEGCVSNDSPPSIQRQTNPVSARRMHTTIAAAACPPYFNGAHLQYPQVPTNPNIASEYCARGTPPSIIGIDPRFSLPQNAMNLTNSSLASLGMQFPDTYTGVGPSDLGGTFLPEGTESRKRTRAEAFLQDAEVHDTCPPSPVKGINFNAMADLEAMGLLKDVPRKPPNSFGPAEWNAVRTCSKEWAGICHELLLAGYDIRLGEAGRSTLKKEISKKLKEKGHLREVCVNHVCRLKNANVMQLMQMAEIVGCLHTALRISNTYWREYNKKQNSGYSLVGGHRRGAIANATSHLGNGVPPFQGESTPATLPALGGCPPQGEMVNASSFIKLDDLNNAAYSTFHLGSSLGCPAQRAVACSASPYPSVMPQIGMYGSNIYVMSQQVSKGEAVAQAENCSTSLVTLPSSNLATNCASLPCFAADLLSAQARENASSLLSNAMKCLRPSSAVRTVTRPKDHYSDQGLSKHNALRLRKEAAVRASPENMNPYASPECQDPVSSPRRAMAAADVVVPQQGLATAALPCGQDRCKDQSSNIEQFIEEYKLEDGIAQETDQLVSREVDRLYLRSPAEEQTEESTRRRIRYGHEVEKQPRLCVVPFSSVGTNPDSLIGVHPPDGQPSSGDHTRVFAENKLNRVLISQSSANIDNPVQCVVDSSSLNSNARLHGESEAETYGNLTCSAPDTVFAEGLASDWLLSILNSESTNCNTSDNMFRFVSCDHLSPSLEANELAVDTAVHNSEYTPVCCPSASSVQLKYE